MTDYDLIRQIQNLERRLRALERQTTQPDPSGWLPESREWTYASATTFTMAGDHTSRYQAGDWVRWVQSSTVKYACVTGVSYSSPNTTITVSGDTVANAAITDTYHSKVLNPQGADLGDFDADQLGSGAATDGYVFTSDGSGGAAWESPGLQIVQDEWSSTSWDGDAKNDASDGTIDLSAVFGLPAGIKAVSVRLGIKAAAAGRYAILSKDAAGAAYGVIARCQVANQYADAHGIVQCDSNGDIYFTAGGDLDEVYIYPNAYWI